MKNESKLADNLFTTKKFQTTKLSNFIETRGNNILKKKEAEGGKVVII